MATGIGGTGVVGVLNVDVQHRGLAFSRDFGSFTSRERHPFVDAMVSALTTGMQKGALSSVPDSWTG